ncbi:MAG: divergent polysaccharide deacetylase family protein [Armatimonadota bacterium]|nr:divergent polysaccharide deacetylase family protein [Armatimonadota bacterium]MDR5703162.1 divergent polysaccharide deacetylase family protein [Armatimonadota bacterium]
MKRPSLFLILLVTVFAGVGTGAFLASRRQAFPPIPRPQHVVPVPKTPEAPKVSKESPPSPPADRKARVAIIFDDAGGSWEDFLAVLSLQRPVTISVLPHLGYSRQIAERAAQEGLEVLLHLPIQPEDPEKALGPGGIRVDMGEEEIRRVVKDDLSAVPGVRGVNNHMGSLGTSDPRVMRAILQEVKERGLFFVDSKTSPRSLGEVLARQLGVPAASRHVFLDNEDDPEYIAGQIKKLIEIALRQGEAIAIGHVHRKTAKVLAEMLPEIDAAGIEIVPVSNLVR